MNICIFKIYNESIRGDTNQVIEHYVVRKLFKTTCHFENAHPVRNPV